MPTVFMSYRRTDSQADARHLRTALQMQLPNFRIVRDIDDIPPGEDFAQYLLEALTACDIVLVLIGPSWLYNEKNGERRLTSPGDRVRQEVAAALDLGKRTIPVLLYGTSMPKAVELPEPLKRLASLQSVAILDRHWERDVHALAQWLRRIAASDRLDRGAAAAFEPPVPASPVADPADERPARVPRRRSSGSWLTLLWTLVALLVGPVLLYLALVAWNVGDEELGVRASQALHRTYEAVPEEDGADPWRRLVQGGAVQVPLQENCFELEGLCIYTEPDYVAPLVRSNADLLRSYAELRGLRAIRMPSQRVTSLYQPADFQVERAYVRLGSLALAAIAARFASGRTESAWGELVQEIQFRRRVMVSSERPVTRAIAMRMLVASLNLTGAALSRYVLPPRHGEPLLAAVAPMTAVERSLDSILDWDLAASVRDASDALRAMRAFDAAYISESRHYAERLGISSELPNPLPFRMPLLNWLATPMFKLHATVNRLEAINALEKSMGSLPAREYLQEGTLTGYLQRRKALRTPQGGFLGMLHNPAGRHFIEARRIESELLGTDAISPTFEEDYFFTHDTDAYLRLLSLQARVQLARPTKAGVQALISAESSLFNPYTGAEVRWEPEVSTLSTTMHGRLAKASLGRVSVVVRDR